MVEGESKARETLRYLGYTFGVIAVAAVVGLLYIILAPIMELLQLLVWLAGAAFLVIFLIAAVFYLFIDKDKK